MIGPVLAVTGLGREAGIATGRGVVAIAGGGDSVALARRLDEMRQGSVGGVVSFGLAGALDPSLEVGDVILAASVVGGVASYPVSAELNEIWAARFDAARLRHRRAAIAGVDAPLLGAADKAALRAETRADAVDMESHIAAAYAARNGLPFAALRVISDGAGRTLPALAGRAMRPDGSVDALGVLRGLLRDPAQIPGLILTARDAAIAFRRLGRVRGLLGDFLGLDL